MHSEDLFINDRSNWQAIEAVCECFPQLDIVPSLALIVESVNAVDGGALVVSTEDEEIFRVLDLVCQQQTYCFKRLFSTIYVITKEQVVGLWWESTVFEETQKVIVLTMDISANLCRLSAMHIKIIGLINDIE